VLTIQRAAFVSEAPIYGTDMPPLVQTLDELRVELQEAAGWVARLNGRLVGAIRTWDADGVLLIGRIAIAPDLHGSGNRPVTAEGGRIQCHRGRREAVHRQPQRSEPAPLQTMRLRRIGAYPSRRRVGAGVSPEATAPTRRPIVSTL
jgi:hypothetical protein